MPIQSLLPLAYSLVGALIAVAATWGRNGETIRQLRDAVEKLTAKIEAMAALEKADALHAQEMRHINERHALLEGRVRHLEEIAHSTPVHGVTPPPRR